jgi:uncharacterized protein with NAD-binding domain and iron-sulfur cluster
MSDQRQKVAILGGGVGGIAAAFALTATDDLRRRYAVTVYQLGWRLGGKGASGRNAALGSRIEEHGLHIWFGFYENAFRIMRECYVELGRPPSAPLATLDDAFTPCGNLVLYEEHDGRWLGWPIDFASNSMQPGEPARLVAFWDMVHLALGWLRDLWTSLGRRRPELAAAAARHGGLIGWLRTVERDVESLFEVAATAAAVGLLEVAYRVAEGRATGRAARSESHLPLVTRALDEFRTWLWGLVERDLDHDELRFFFTSLDTTASVIRGIVADGLITRGLGAVDGEEMRAWLGRHGATPLTLTAGPLVRFMYDLAFASRDGDVTRQDLAAGVALTAALRLVFTYKGAFFFKMQAGMGDTIFAPFYEVLSRRGVEFEFFHAVTRLGLTADRRAVDSIQVVPQARLAVATYDPLVEVNGLPCWPSEPRWEQLVDGERLQRLGVDFEQEVPSPIGDAPRVLRRGEDFDLVVLAIPPAAAAPLCAELIADPANPKFRAMIEGLPSTMTQAFQLWVTRPLEALGWPFAVDSIMTAFVEPLDTYADMSHLIPRESWPAGAGVRSIAYFCGVLPDQPGDTNASVTERVRQNALAYVRRHLRVLWPVAAPAFSWADLIDPQERQGEARFAAQFWRANFQPSERYVLSTAGSIRHRLAADGSGYANLFLAGDWVDNGALNAGCVEAAVMAGLQAARAIVGSPEPLVADGPPWLVEDLDR